MILSWEGGASDEGAVSERDAEEESPLPQSAKAGEGGGVRDSAVCEGPLLSALLNKIETLLDQVCVCGFSVCVCSLVPRLSFPLTSPKSLGTRLVCMLLTYNTLPYHSSSRTKLTCC